MNIIFSSKLAIYIYFTFSLSYLYPSDMYCGTEKSLYNCCQHSFKHLAAFVHRLANFSSRGTFSSQNLAQSLGELEI